MPRKESGAESGAKGLNCGGLLKCDQKCGSSRSCTDNCYSNSTAVAQGLFTAFDDCLSVQCPSSDGGACASSSSSACSNCNQNAAQVQCVARLAGCEDDMKVGPPNGDGGALLPDGGNNDVLACGGLLACESACTTDGGMGAYEQCLAACKYSATAQAISLYASLETCLNKACPTTKGGPCATPGTKCAGCQEVAVFAMPNTCAPPFEKCQHDRSNVGGGTSTPTAGKDAGELSTVVTGLVQAASTLAVSNGYLYFAEVIGTSPVRRVFVGDGGSFPDGGTMKSAAETVGPPHSTPVALAVDSNNVYVWATGTYPGTTSFNNSDGVVTQIALDGGSAITLRKGIEVLYDADYLNGIVVDSKNVYWLEGAKGKDGVIMKTPIGSASPKPVYTGQEIPQALATDGNNLYWANWGTFDSTGASNNDGTMWQGSVDGGTPQLLASNQPAPGAMAIDTNNVYWTNLGRLGADLFPATNSGSVMQVPIGGGKVTTLASSVPIPVGIGVANGRVYWTVYGLSVPGLVVSVPVGGGTPVTEATGLNDPFELTVSGNTAYWSNTPSSNGMGAILALTMP
jgi:hypothetical protein